MVNVYIPTPFRGFVGNRTSVEVDGSDVAEVLANLDARFPGFRDLCFNAEGAIPAHINIYVNNKEIGSLDGPSTKLEAGDQLAVIPALAGGADPSTSSGQAEDPSNYALTPERVTRYSRHLIMPQVGSVGQRKLFDAKVLMVGAGGLGSPVALYLALAGVGSIGIVDFDTVDLSNLQRQILHQNDDIGKPKVQSARETLNAYNPDVKV
ncbi:MAG TPA: ThiF family adenylyltransferase, partial [Dehalococcoidia bacterium]|nr:ThiF family adenylyltransferase [Dehalococcoidia bacterium]